MTRSGLMPRYDAVIFDLDGTLLDTLDDLAGAVNYALREKDLPTRSREEIREFVGNGVKLLIDRAVPPGTGQETAAECLTLFKSWYTAHMEDKTAPYPGIPALLRELKEGGCKTAVVSNKFDAAVQSLCERYFPGMIDAAAGEGPSVPKKPDPAMVFRALDKLGVPPERAVYVGDAGTDIDTANNAGLDIISVTWGFRSREFLLSHGAKILVDAPADVKDKVLKNC